MRMLSPVRVGSRCLRSQHALNPTSIVQRNGVMAELYFEPFVGCRYRAAPIQLWLLAESHYEPDVNDHTPDYTKRTVDLWAYQKRSRFFTSLACTITGEPAWKVDRPRVFDQIAYSNFVQSFLNGPRLAPTEQQWHSGKLAFAEQLQDLRPTHVLVCGRRLWDHIPFEGAEEWRTPGRIGAARVLGMTHPSSWGHSWRKWSPIVQEFLRC